MVRSGRRCNNKGVSLVLVIISMTFISVIAALVLALTYRNLVAVQTGLNSSKNFYTAETAMDELKTKFYEYSDLAVRDAYPLWLQKYNGMDETTREEEFMKMYVEKLEKVIDDKFIKYYFEDGHTGDINDLFVSFSSDNIKWNSKFKPYLDVAPDKTSIVVRNLSIIYTDTRNYQTAITTDFNFGLNYIPFKTNKANQTDDSCSEYSVIADEQVNNVANSTITIDGSIYGGGYEVDTDEYSQPGILFNGGSLNVYADNIVSRNDIVMTNSISSDFNGLEGRDNYLGDNSTCNIWSRGIKLAGAPKTSMKINGNCYVYDDTSIDAKEAELTIDGSYYGFNTDNSSENLTDDQGVSLTMGTPKGSSSITINGTDSKVDLTGCSSVFLAGKTFISVPKIYGSPDIDDSNVAFPQGESISYRGVQSMYLLPGDCIKGIGHNPLTESEYNRLVEDMAKEQSADRKYDILIDQNRRNGGVDLIKYVDISKPYRVATVNYDTGSQSEPLVYLYLNFASSASATKYFQAYYAKFPDAVESKMAMLGAGQVLFDPSTLITTGNAIGYDSDKKVTLKNSRLDIFDESVTNKQSELNNKYYGMCVALDQNFSGIDIYKFTSDKFVDFTRIKSDLQTDKVLDYKGDNGQPYHLITGKDITIDNNINAVVVAKGNVNIAAGAIVHGLIIARGSVNLSGGGLVAEPEDVSDLILGNKYVNNIFYGDDIVEEEDSRSNSLYSSELISIDYKNWRKN